MKLSHVRIERGGVQAKPGRLMGAYDSSEYDLVLISNLRCIKLSKPAWGEPVYVPMEHVESFSPLIEDK